MFRGGSRTAIGFVENVGSGPGSGGTAGGCAGGAGPAALVDGIGIEKLIRCAGADAEMNKIRPAESADRWIEFIVEVYCEFRI